MKKRIRITLEEKLHRALSRRAQAQRRTVGDHIRFLVECDLAGRLQLPWELRTNHDTKNT